MTSSLSRVLATCLTLSTAAIVTGNASADTLHNFSNPTPIAIGADPSPPYPSAITVGGLTGNVAAVTVTLNNVTHSFAGDIDVMLVGPGGQQVMLMSDVGYGYGSSNVTLSFSANASSDLPVPPASGIWRPTNLDDSGAGDGGNDVFPAPAPAGTPGTDLTVFNDTDANGSWRLFVRDDYPASDAGSINGWSLSITTGFASCAAEGYRGTKLTLCRQVCESHYPPSTIDMLIRAWVRLYRTEPPCAG